MRILVVDSPYREFVADFYARRPGLEEASYAEQLSAYWELGFGTGDGYVRYLREAGHETVHVLDNCVPAQRAWLREHPAAVTAPLARALGRPGRVGRVAQRATLLLQIERLRPDVLFLDDLWTVTDRELDWLRRRVPFLVGQIASYPPPIERMQRFDLMLSSFPHFVERFRAAGIDSEPFRLAFLPAVAEHLQRVGVSTDPAAAGRRGAVFVGGFYPNTYERAIPAMEQLCAEVDVAVYGPAPEGLAADSPIWRRHRGEAWGLDMYRRLAGARVVVNRHSDYAEGHANNMRLYEATGVGATLVTESAPNLHELFRPGQEVATYADAEELVAVVRSLLADEDRAIAIARAGQERTLTEHTYARRMRELAAMLEERQAAGRFRSSPSRR